MTTKQNVLKAKIVFARHYSQHAWARVWANKLSAELLSLTGEVYSFGAFVNPSK